MLWSNLNTLRPRQNGCLFADDTFKRIFVNENIRISIKNSLKFVPNGLINNISASVLIMAWRRPGDKPLSEPMLVRSLTHICVTRPQWVKSAACCISRWWMTKPSLVIGQYWCKLEQNFLCLVYNGLNRSQLNFAHAMTVFLSWCVKKVVVIDWSCYRQGHCEISLNFRIQSIYR